MSREEQLRARYHKLRDLLAAGKWFEADLETGLLMLQAAGREKEGCFSVEDLKIFPCEDLRTIDKLWVKYSNGRFGFSVQKRIWSLPPDRAMTRNLISARFFASGPISEKKPGFSTLTERPPSGVKVTCGPGHGDITLIKLTDNLLMPCPYRILAIATRLKTPGDLTPILHQKR